MKIKIILRPKKVLSLDLFDNVLSFAIDNVFAQHSTAWLKSHSEGEKNHGKKPRMKAIIHESFDVSVGYCDGVELCANW